MRAMNGFNSIAWAYDRLGRIVFGDSILRAQRHFLDRLPAGGKILFIGGGTGEILPELIHLRPETEIWFVEASSEMIEKTKARISQDDRVIFIHGTEANIPAAVEFNAVITNFFLDLFSPIRLTSVIEKIDAAVCHEGLWLCADFCNNDRKFWKRVTLMVMYVFFRLTARIEAKFLPPWQHLLQGKGYSNEESKQFFNDFICSVVFRKR